MSDTLDGKMVRAYSHILMARFIEERLSPEARASVHEQIGDVLARVGQMKEENLESAADFGRMMAAVAATEKDPKAGYDRVSEAGTFIGQHALGTFLRLLIKFLRPGLFMRKFPELWKRDHNFGEFTPELDQIDQKRAVMNVKGVGGYTYIAGLCCGWVACPLEAMGCKNVKIVETLSPPPSPQDRDEYRLEVSWE